MNIQNIENKENNMCINTYSSNHFICFYII